MTEDSSETTVGSPLYLIKSFEPCWKCRKEQRVVALASRRLRTADFDTLDAGESSVLYFLINIDQMPQVISDYLFAAHPQFQQRHSRTMGMTYFANTCADCGANFGDHYLFSEPEGAFWPQSTKQAKRITVIELPFAGLHVFRCSWAAGTGGFLFEHALKQPMA